MSWMKRLYDVYENNIDKVGEFETRGDSRFTLLPISHVTQSAQIEVVLDRQGHFYKATVVPKEEARTIVPASIESANRSSTKIAPHFIHDKLFYVAGDYLKYGGEEKRGNNYSLYMEQMKSWVNSLYSHSKVELVFRYVSRGTLIEDLIKENVLFVDENNRFIEKWTKREEERYGLEKPDIYKVVSGKSSEAFVRFTILSETPDDPPLWEDKTLFQSFINFYTDHLQKTPNVGECYVTGENVILTDKHGSRIRHAGDMSKLVSANDHQGFTYRGRFEKPEHAVLIGYEASQKAHNALRWLNQRQGYMSDSRYFITFGVKSPDMIQPFNGSIDMYNNPFGFFTDASESSIQQDFTSQVFAEQVQQALKGKKHNFEVNKADQVIVIALDAATTGRLAIVYYQELEIKLFLDRITHWHDTCKWYQFYRDKNSKKLVRFIGTPSTYHIVENIYGEKVDSKVKKELYTRLLPCIVDQAKIPKDIVMSIFHRVKNPMSFNLSSGILRWEEALSVACALIKKMYEKEDIEVALDTTNRNRDYLFGRLLAVAEVLERSELERRDEARATNALRYFNAFSQRPARTWKTIRQQLHPYQMRAAQGTNGSRAKYLTRLIEEIEASFNLDDLNNDPLGPLFLLGYSSQIQDLYTKKVEKEEEEQ